MARRPGSAPGTRRGRWCCRQTISEEPPARGANCPCRFHGFLADLVVAIHLGFVLFVAGGGLLGFRWRRVPWVHVPAVVWGVLIEWMGWVCPLTPLENWLRVRAGGGGYEGQFVEHYLLPVLYPAALTRDWQVGLGLLVLVVNGLVYGAVIRRR